VKDPANTEANYQKSRKFMNPMKGAIICAGRAKLALKKDLIVLKFPACVHTIQEILGAEIHIYVP
jgi:hypothetical protein